MSATGATRVSARSGRYSSRMNSRSPGTSSSTPSNSSGPLTKNVSLPPDPRRGLRTAGYVISRASACTRVLTSDWVTASAAGTGSPPARRARRCSSLSRSKSAVCGLWNGSASSRASSAAGCWAASVKTAIPSARASRSTAAFAWWSKPRMSRTVPRRGSRRARELSSGADQPVTQMSSHSPPADSASSSGENAPGSYITATRGARPRPFARLVVCRCVTLDRLQDREQLPVERVDALVGDHQAGGQGVAQQTPDRVLGVVAVRVDAHHLEHRQTDARCPLGCVELEVVEAQRRGERAQRRTIGLLLHRREVLECGSNVGAKRPQLAEHARHGDGGRLRRTGVPARGGAHERVSALERLGRQTEPHVRPQQEAHRGGLTHHG